MVTPPKQNSACMAETAETPVQSPPCEKKSQLANNYGSCCKMHTTALYAPSVRTQKQNTMDVLCLWCRYPLPLEHPPKPKLHNVETRTSGFCVELYRSTSLVQRALADILVGYVNTRSISLLLDAAIAVASILRSRRRPKRMQSSPANNSADAARLKDHN